MLNPKLKEIVVDKTDYAVMFQDFGSFVRLNVYRNGKRVGCRKLPRTIDQGSSTIAYLIRRMVGNYGNPEQWISPQFVEWKEKFYNGNR